MKLGIVDAAAALLQGLPIWRQVSLIFAVSVVAARVIELLTYVAISRSDQLTGRSYETISTVAVRTPLYLFVSSAAISVLVALRAYTIVRLSGRLVGAVDGSPSS